jgi:hypothetical protein
MKRLSQLVFQYYQLLWFYNIAFSFIIGYLTSAMGFGKVTGSIYGKIVGIVAAMGLYHFSSAKTYFYFRNAGLSIRSLFMYTFIFDLVLFTFLFTLILLCNHLF